MTDQAHRYAALGPEPVKTIGRDELKRKLDSGDDLKLVMALNRWAYDAKRIPGSLHFDTPEQLYAALTPEDDIVVYCSQVDCLSSVARYPELVKRRYNHLRRDAGGVGGWVGAGGARAGAVGGSPACWGPGCPAIPRWRPRSAGTPRMAGTPWRSTRSGPAGTS